jgi:hypothetical protein
VSWKEQLLLLLLLPLRLVVIVGFKEGRTMRLNSLRRGEGLAVAITMMVEEADARDVVPGLATKADLGDGTTGDGDGHSRQREGSS